MATRQEAATTSRLQEACALGVAAAADDNGDEGDEFEDATEQQPATMDLEYSFLDCEAAIRKFFNNDLTGAMDIMKPWNQTSLYHSLGTAIFEFIPAMLTFDHGQINRALGALKACLTICDHHKKNFSLVESLGTILRKHNYVAYTDIEAHAELCYAEAVLLQAAMTIMDGEDLTGLIRGTIKIKSCYNSYKECARIMEKKGWQSLQSKIHFESGVRLGLATFNVMISLLPQRVINLLEFVGFSGNKKLGLAELEAGSRSPGIRSVLCDLTLLGYHLVICHFIGAEADLGICDEILRKELNVYPESVWFLVFKGRLELMNGNFEPAIAIYNRAIAQQDTWVQFRHLCYWEVMWVNSLKMEWREAALYANKLIEESAWSKTIYSYTRAAMLLQVGNLSNEEKLECNELLRKASTFKQRIAGKSLPMEKFVLKRCARQLSRSALVLPAVELMCLWNMFHILAKNERAAQNVLKLIEATRAECEAGGGLRSGPYGGDNRALLRFMHGSLLAAMGLPRLALDTLETVLQLKSEIREDTFLLPYSLSEMAMCHFHLGDKHRAVQLLQDARRKYSGYSLEYRLHFRLHSKMEIVRGNDDSIIEAAPEECIRTIM